MGRLSVMLALISKDLLVEAREKIDAYVRLGFTFASGVLGAAAATYSRDPASVAAGAMILFALFLSLFESYASFIKESLQGTLDGLRASPVEGWVLVLARTLLSWLILGTGLLVFAATLDAFSYNVSVAWPPLAAWSLAVALFLASIAGFVAATLSHGEARTGSVALLVLVLSIPYLRIAVDPLATILAGVYPDTSIMVSLWAVAGAFTGISLVLGGLILD